MGELIRQGEMRRDKQKNNGTGRRPKQDRGGRGKGACDTRPETKPPSPSSRDVMDYARTEEMRKGRSGLAAVPDH